MDDRRFDALARALGAPTDRRTTTKALLRGTLAALGLGGAAGLGPKAKAKKKKKKRPKPCPSGQARCGAACVDPQSNAGHCGGCGRVCPAGQSCSGGACQLGPCQGDQIRCGGPCVDLEEDDAHCGECGNVCNGDLTCISGACGCATGTRCGAQCVDPQTNRTHCGGCDDACPGNQVCTGGTCGDPPECTSQAQCGGSGSFNDLVCRDGRCVCSREGHGICHRFPDGRGSCHQCCPGGNLSCPGEYACLVYQTPAGPLAGICTCPTGQQQCRDGSIRCVGASQSQGDARKCGLDCVDCTTRDPGSSCCNGGCARGCAPGSQCGGINGPCGANCSMCPEGSICCNRGPGSSAQCIPNRNGFCYVP